jgi:hypothetical protein
MIPLFIICAFLLLVFLIIINKTREGLQFSEVANIAQVYTNNELLDTDKLEQLNDKKNNKIISDTEIIAILESTDLSESQKLEKIYGLSLDTLFNQRMTESIYSTFPQSKRLDSTAFKNILAILYDESIDDPSVKITSIKEMNIKDPYLLTIIDNTTTSDNVKLFGKELDGEEIITTDNIEQNLVNPPPIPEEPSKSSKKFNKLKNKLKGLNFNNKKKKK